MKYLVKVDALEWHNLVFEVEADSAGEAEENFKIFGDLISDDYDCTDEYNVTNVEEITDED